MEDDLYAIRRRVEQLYPPDLIQDGVAGIVRHVVGRDWWQSVPLEREDPTLEKNLVFVRQEVIWCWENGVLAGGASYAMSRSS